MNNQLIDLYKKEITLLKSTENNSVDFDGPLLMQVWEEEYLNSEYKILFFGRESNGWIGDITFDVDEAIKKYVEFELCNYGDYTTFWQYIYNFKNILMPETIGQRNFLWSNVSKFSKLNGKALELDDFKFLCSKFNVLQSEIEITKPDVIIFFSGSSWDEKIQFQINNEIKFTQVVDNISANELSRLESKSLPFHTYRIDHPITLQTQKKWKYLDLIIDDIKNRD